MIFPISLPIVMPGIPATCGHPVPREPGKLDWAKAPAWAQYACVNTIGGWEWWAARPKWDWFMGWWEGEILRQAALVYVAVYDRRARKMSLHARPGGV